MCSCDFDPPTVHRSEQRTARKQHRCAECPAVIAPGDRYVAEASLTDGSWGSWKLCMPCHEMAQAFVDDENAAGETACWAIGGLAEAIEDCDGAREALAPHLEAWRVRCAGRAA
jgi:hypothetical protein